MKRQDLSGHILLAHQSESRSFRQSFLTNHEAEPFGHYFSSLISIRTSQTVLFLISQMAGSRKHCPSSRIRMQGESHPLLSHFPRRICRCPAEQNPSIHFFSSVGSSPRVPIKAGGSCCLGLGGKTQPLRLATAFEIIRQVHSLVCLYLFLLETSKGSWVSPHHLTRVAEPHKMVCRFPELDGFLTSHLKW